MKYYIGLSLTHNGEDSNDGLLVCSTTIQAKKPDRRKKLLSAPSVKRFMVGRITKRFCKGRCVSRPYNYRLTPQRGQNATSHREPYIRARRRQPLLSRNADKFTPYTEDHGELFRSYQKTNGGCTGKVYIDTPDGTPDHIGWVFEKKRQFDDWSPGDKERYYKDETWVTLKDVRSK